VYYPPIVKQIAMNNNQPFHLAAWTRIGTSWITGTNSGRCSSKFRRVHPDGTLGFHLHAEMDLIRKFEPGTLREISVARFTKDGNITMSMPCKYCKQFLREHGVKKVRYTDWNGEWSILDLTKDE
jgi:hypothetical protein